MAASFVHIHIGGVKSLTRTNNKLELLPGQKIGTKLLDSLRHSAERPRDDEFVDDWHKKHAQRAHQFEARARQSL